MIIISDSRYTVIVKIEDGQGVFSVLPPGFSCHIDGPYQLPR